MTKGITRRLLLAAVTTCAATIGFFPVVAKAHAVLESSSPAASQTLATSPDEISLDFSEAIETSFSQIELFDSDEKEVSIGPVVRSSTDNSVISSKAPVLKDGLYVVVWRVVSVDGHPVTGAFPFSVGTGTTTDGTDLVDRVISGGKSDSQLRWALALARLFGFLGAIVLVGHLWLTWGAASQWSLNSVNVMKRATTALASGSAGVLLLQGPLASGGSWSSVFDLRVIGDVMSTRLGIAALVRLATVVVWGGLVLYASRARTFIWQTAAMVAAALTLVTFSVSGHPSADQTPTLLVTMDLVHLIAVSVWVGGVIALWTLMRDDAGETLAARLSRHATWSMPVVVVTGVIQALALTDGISHVTQSGYGRLLVAKIAIVMAAIALGARGRRALRSAGHTAIRSTLAWETSLVAVVIALTSVLVGLSPDSRTNASGDTYSVTLVQSGVLADLTVAPTKVGAVEIHAFLSPPGGSLEPVQSMAVSLSLPGRDVPPIPVSMTSLGTNHFAGVVQIPYPGTWTMEARVIPKTNVTLLFSASVEIKD